MIIKKDRAEMLRDMYQSMQTRAGINTAEDGSIAKSMIDVIGYEIYNLFDYSDFIQQMAYVSTATGEYLNKIGELLDVQRIEFESDSDYRNRITTKVQTFAGGNKLSIEQALISIPDVADYEYREFSHGPGSYTVYIYPTVGVDNEYVLIQKVKDILAGVTSEGIFYDVKVPESVVVDLEMIIQFTDNSTEMEKRGIKTQIKQSVSQYISSLKKNQVLVINEIVQKTLNSSEKIVDMGIINLKINGKNQRITNTYPLTDQRFVVGSIKLV